MRGRQPAETDEHVERADGIALGERSLGGADDAPLEII